MNRIPHLNSNLECTNCTSPIETHLEVIEPGTSPMSTLTGHKTVNLKLHSTTNVAKIIYSKMATKDRDARQLNTSIL